MAGAHAHEPLVVMLAMRVPNALAARKAPQQRERRVADEGSKDEEREPERPDVVAPAHEAERRGQETQRHGADIAQKDARRRKIEQQESRRRRGERHTCRRERRVSSSAGSERVGAEADERHAAGETIGAVHEVVEVGDPRHAERKERELCRMHRAHQVPRGERRHREVRGEPRTGGEALQVIGEREQGQHQGQAERKP